MKLTTRIFRLMVLLQPLLLYAMAFKNTLLIQLISDFILIGSFLQFFLVINIRGAIKKPILILAFLIMIIAFLSLYLGGFSYSGLVAYLMFVSMIFAWIVYPSINTNEMNILCRYSFILQALLLMFFSRQPFAYDSIDDGEVVTSEMLTLGFNNPNLASMIVFYVLVAILMFYYDEKRSFMKLIYVILLAILFYLIFETECRTIVLMSVFLIVSFFFSKGYLLASIMKNKVITILALAFPIIFGLLYVYFSLLPQFRDLELFGKPLFSGREVLFVDFYNTLSDSPIIGLCGKYKFANAHNGMLAILLNTGFIGLFLYLIYAYKNLRLLSQFITKQKDVICLIAILAVFISSSSESAMLVAGNLFYVYFVYMLSFARSRSIQ